MSSRRRVLQAGVAALGGSLTGCLSGALDTTASDSPASGGRSATTDASASDSGEPSGEPTTHATGVGASLPKASVEFPEGPKSRPERPADLTPETVREFVKTFEYRWVYNELYRNESTAVHAESGVDSVTTYGVGYRIVAWCSAYANTEQNGSTIHADYFTQYATYFVGPETLVRRDGKPGGRR